MSKPEIYVSTDVETDGPIPGPHSMLSFASAAYTADKKRLVLSRLTYSLYLKRKPTRLPKRGGIKIRKPGWPAGYLAKSLL